MKHGIKEYRLKVPTWQGGQLFVRQFLPEAPQALVVLLHGLGNKGDVFCHQGHGLAQFLADMGFHCLVPDLIGHGQSWPNLSRRLDHDANLIIREDLPRLMAEARRQADGLPIFLVGQGFGGVLLASSYAREPGVRPGVLGMIHLGTRRNASLGGVHHSTLSRLTTDALLPALGTLKGAVPMRWLGKGPEPEYLTLYRDYLRWSNGPWVAHDDTGFDYAAAAQHLDWPPSLYLARRNGGYTDHVADVREFMRELGTHNGRLWVLGKRDGNLRNYSAQSMLIHDDAWVDHFPVLLDWINERLRQLPKGVRVRHLVSVDSSS